MINKMEVYIRQKSLLSDINAMEYTPTDEYSRGYNKGLCAAYELASGEKATETIPTLKEIASHYGFSSQADMLTEEAAEFTVALNKFRRGHADAYNDLREEVADVLVIALQLRYLLGEEEVDKIMGEKIDRQIKRITTEEWHDRYNRLKELDEKRRVT